MGDLIPRGSRAWLLCCAVVVGLALPGCGGGVGDGGPGEGPGRRYQALALSSQQEVKLGDEAFQEVLQQEHPLDDPALVGRVQETADGIFDVALKNIPLRREINLSDNDPYGRPWDFNHRKYVVLKDKAVNAFCLPGGKIAVFKGLLDMTEGHPDWLATVLGHEIAHALAHHANERIAREKLDGEAVDSSASGLGVLDADERWKLIGLLGAGSYRPLAARGDQGGSIFGQIREMAFDRQQEAEADHIGVFLMTFVPKSGSRPAADKRLDPRYDPRQAVVFWEAMQQQGGASPPEILSDHPSDAHRVALMKGWVVQAENALEAYNAGRIEPTAKP